MSLMKSKKLFLDLLIKILWDIKLFVKYFKGLWVHLEKQRPKQLWNRTSVKSLYLRLELDFMLKHEETKKEGTWSEKDKRTQQ